MKILLLGASGQLGKEISLQLDEHEVDGYSSAEFDFASSEPFQLDKTYDVIINAMAMTNTGECEENPAKAYLLNATRVGEIAKLAKKMNANFFHFSTDYVFDGLSYSAYTEKSEVAPVSIYGLSKLAGEFSARMYHAQTFIFRVSSLYGIHGNNFVRFMLNKAKSGDDLKLVNDQVMSPTHTLDVAKAVKHFIDNSIKDYGVYHCSNEGKCSWSDFAREFLNEAELDVKVEEVSWKDFPAKLQRPVDSHMSVEKINHYYKMPKWQDSIAEFIKLWENEK